MEKKDGSVVSVPISRFTADRSFPIARVLKARWDRVVHCSIRSKQHRSSSSPTTHLVILSIKLRPVYSKCLCSVQSVLTCWCFAICCCDLGHHTTLFFFFFFLKQQLGILPLNMTKLYSFSFRLSSGILCGQFFYLTSGSVAVFGICFAVERRRNNIIMERVVNCFCQH